jgi:SAM-dependent methyltransferase
MHNFDYVQKLLKNYQAATVDSRISPNDSMNNQWYFEVGRSAVDIIALALMASKSQTVNRVLDLPCGHGRVLRHLICLFPGAEFHGCDLDMDGLDFCAKNFGAVPVHSKEELTDVDFGTQYDLMWVGSLFTHTAQEVTKRWTTHLSRFLSPRGIIVATLHGRWCQYVHKAYPYIAEYRWKGILQDYSAKGYGYRDYPEGDAHAFISGSYGVSMAKPHVTIQNLEEIPGIRIYLYLERGWADHQDVVAFGCPSYDELWPGMSK